MSPAMQAAVHAALDRADAERATVVLAGRDERFSAALHVLTVPAVDPALAFVLARSSGVDAGNAVKADDTAEAA